MDSGSSSSLKSSMRQYLEDAKDLRYYLRTGISRNESLAGSRPRSGSDASAADASDGTASLMMTPMDKLCLELDACWPGGAGTSHDETTGEPLLAGAGRIMHPRGSHEPGFCHVDDMAVMKNFQAILGQCVPNASTRLWRRPVYGLSMCSLGGILPTRCVAVAAVDTGAVGTGCTAACMPHLSASRRQRVS